MENESSQVIRNTAMGILLETLRKTGYKFEFQYADGHITTALDTTYQILMPLSFQTFYYKYLVSETIKMTRNAQIYNIDTSVHGLTFKNNIVTLTDHFIWHLYGKYSVDCWDRRFQLKLQKSFPHYCSMKLGRKTPRNLRL
jgi:hypothetical protein